MRSVIEFLVALALGGSAMWWMTRKSWWWRLMADWCVPASALDWGRLTRPWDHGMDITAFLTHDSFRGWGR